jgi:ribosomal protein S6--L-glutamate ligase
VQDLIEGPGEDLKVYVVGDRVWAVRKRFSPTSFSVPGRPVPVTREVEDIALCAAAATGLGLFGLDIIEGTDGPVVVDTNYFPGYKGCVGVADLMAAYIHDYATGAVNLVLPPMAHSPLPAVVGPELVSVD